MTEIDGVELVEGEGPTEDPRFLAGMEFLRRTGATELQIGHSDEEEPPVVWYARAKYWVLEGKPVKPETEGSIVYYDGEAGMDPVTAVLRLCARMADGGECAHCHRPTAFDPAMLGVPMPLESIVCWYQYDPGSQKFIQGCTTN